MTVSLDPFERWMVKSNLQHIASGADDAATVIAIVRHNGYGRVADAIENEINEQKGAKAHG